MIIQNFFTSNEQVFVLFIKAHIVKMTLKVIKYCAIVDIEIAC